MRPLGLTSLGGCGVSQGAMNTSIDNLFQEFDGVIQSSGTNTHAITDGLNRYVSGWAFTSPLADNVSLSFQVSETVLTVTSSLGEDDPGHTYTVTLKRRTTN